MNVFRRFSILLIASATFAGCNSNTPETNATSGSQSPVAGPKAPKLDFTGAKSLQGGLKYKDEDQPTAANAGPDKTLETGDEAVMEYTGSFADGTIFDSNIPKDPSIPEKPPFNFVVGSSPVIKGWEVGLVGMHVGQTRDLDIPSALGYGVTGRPPTIPPNTELFFKVKLLALVKPNQTLVFDTKDLKPGVGKAAVTGNIVTITYDGTLLNGFSFANAPASAPLTFQVGTGKINSTEHIGVSGLAFAVAGMKAGGVRLITLPPEIGYAPQALPSGVPPGSVTQFKVTLLKIAPGSTLPKSAGGN